MQRVLVLGLALGMSLGVLACSSDESSDFPPGSNNNNANNNVPGSTDPPDTNWNTDPNNNNNNNWNTDPVNNNNNNNNNNNWNSDPGTNTDNPPQGYTQCDNSGDCWGKCWGCAVSSGGRCEAVSNACYADATCRALDECINPACDNASDWQACYDGCVATHGGEAMLKKVWDCVYCLGCLNDCAPKVSYDCSNVVDTETPTNPDTGSPDTGTPVDTSNTVAVSVTGVATWRGNATAAYSIIHDDTCDYSTSGLSTSWQELTNRGLRAGFGAIAGTCQKREGEMGPFLKQLVNAGHEIINHSQNHLNMLTNSTADQHTEFVQSKTNLEALCGTKVEYFVFPEDAYNDSHLTYLQNNGYLGARAGVRGTDNANMANPPGLGPFKANFDCFNENRGGSDANCSKYPSNTMQAYLADIIAQMGSGIRELHGVGDSSWGNITLAQYTAHLDYVVQKINAGQVWMDTPTTVMKYRVSRAVCGTPSANNGVITFSNATGPDCKKYSTPLSVLVTAPSAISANQDGKNIEVKSLGSNQYAVDVNPAGGPAYVVTP